MSIKWAKDFVNGVQSMRKDGGLLTLGLRNEEEIVNIDVHVRKWERVDQWSKGSVGSGPVLGNRGPWGFDGWWMGGKGLQSVGPRGLASAGPDGKIRKVAGSFSGTGEVWRAF